MGKFSFLKCTKQIHKTFILSILLYAAISVYKIITLVKQKIKNIHRGRH